MNINEPIISVSNLVKKFGDFIAVNNIDFDILKGEILGFLGPNGAGKTTTIKMINGLLKISSGSIRIKGMDSEKERDKVKEIMGYMSQKFSLYSKLTAIENIEFFGGISGLNKKTVRKKVDEINEYIPKESLKTITGKLPPGIRQKVALFVALLPNPEIIFLDEPTSGVDPNARREFWFDIYKLKKKGKTVLVSTHNLDEVEYADRIIILHKGNILIKGKPEELKKSNNVRTIEELFKGAISNYEKV